MIPLNLLLNRYTIMIAIVTIVGLYGYYSVHKWCDNRVELAQLERRVEVLDNVEKINTAVRDRSYDDLVKRVYQYKGGE